MGVKREGFICKMRIFQNFQNCFCIANPVDRVHGHVDHVGSDGLLDTMDQRRREGHSSSKLVLVSGSGDRFSPRGDLEEGRNVENLPAGSPWVKRR
jgi:hypothetical protein